MAKFGKRSLANLKTCHPDLQKIMTAAILWVDFSVVCGHRSEKKQTEAYQNGYSKLEFPLSKHNIAPSKAVDVIPYPTGYKNIKKFNELAKVIKTEATRLNIDIVWGGNFRTWKDYPHWQLK